jgi:hypothetical protein
MFDLPKHLQDYIYEFDPTYRIIFNFVLYEMININLIGECTHEDYKHWKKTPLYNLVRKNMNKNGKYNVDITDAPDEILNVNYPDDYYEWLIDAEDENQDIRRLRYNGFEKNNFKDCNWYEKYILKTNKFKHLRKIIFNHRFETNNGYEIDMNLDNFFK